jgi:hypothetical protein
VAIGEAPEDISGPVGRTVIGYEQDPVRVSLSGDRFQLLGKKRRAVFRAHQYGDLRGTDAHVRHPSGNFSVGRHGLFKPS